MASLLELKRLKLDLMTISYAKAQTEFRIQEYQEQIDSLHPTLKLQIEKEEELTQKLKDVESQEK